MTAREDQIVEAFSALADTLTTDPSPPDFLQLLVERAVGLLQVDAGGVFVYDPGGRLQSMASSDHSARLVGR